MELGTVKSYTLAIFGTIVKAVVGPSKQTVTNPRIKLIGKVALDGSARTASFRHHRKEPVVKWNLLSFFMKFHLFRE